MAYVVTHWYASTTPTSDGSYIHLTGRQGGIMSFVLSRVGISPTVHLIVDADHVVVERGSWSGFLRRVIPLRSVSSAVYGYHKPWWVLMIGLLLGLAFLLDATDQGRWINKFRSFMSAIVAFGIGGTIYFLNRSLILGIAEIGGALSSLRFKRSVIEAQDVKEHNARQVTDIIQWLLDRKMGSPPPEE